MMKRKQLHKALAALMAMVMVLCSLSIPILAEEPAGPGPTEEIGEGGDPTPSPTPLDEATATATPIPEATATPLPEVTASPDPTVSATATPEPEATTEPTATAEPTQEPVVTAEPTQVVTSAPEPTATAEPSPVATATPDPTEIPWDESQCDHANAQCVNAPACENGACAHIGRDAHGLEIPLCALGEWLLDRQDAMAREGMGGRARARSASITLDLSRGDITLYRSGNYTITGFRENAEKELLSKVTIKENRIVSLTFQEAKGSLLRLEKGVRLNAVFNEMNIWNTIDVGANAFLVFGGPGAMESTSVKMGADAYVQVQGGSVNASFSELNGYTKYVFPAGGANRITINGAEYPAAPGSDGKVYLWLPKAGDSMEYTSVLSGNTLGVTLEPTKATEPGALRTISWADIGAASMNYVITQPGTYRLAGNMTGTQGLYTITLRGEGIELMLDGVAATGGYSLTLIDEKSNNIRLSGHSALQNGTITISPAGVTTIVGGGSAVITGAGTGTLNLRQGNVQYQGSTSKITIQGKNLAPAAFQNITLSKDVTAIFGDSAYPLAWIDTNTLLLPVKSGVFYTVDQEGNNLLISEMQESEQSYVSLPAQQGNYTLSGAQLNMNVIIDGQGQSWSHQLTVPAGYRGEITLRNVKDINLVVEAGAQPVFVLEGQNTLADLTYNATALSIKGSGNLLVTGAAITATTFDIKGNVKFVSGLPTALLETVITVTNDQGQPVASAEVTLRVGQALPFQTTTFSDGTIHLLGGALLDQQDVAVSDGDTTYTAVIMGGGGDAKEWIDIQNIQATTGSVNANITFTAAEAKTAGVQYLVGEGPLELPDTYVDGAKRMKATGGQGWEAAITEGLTAGQVITYRVYAAREENAELKADTADGFTFGPLLTLRVKGTLTADAIDMPDRAYDATAYAYTKAPQDVTVSYEDAAGNALSGPPTDAGSYFLVLTVPGDHPVYSNTTPLRKAFNITKTDNPLEIKVPSVAYGTALVPEVVKNWGGKVTYRYTGINGTQYNSTKAPDQAGSYRLTATAEANNNVTEKTITVDFTIHRKQITIMPEPNQMKFQGEEDPPFGFTYAGFIHNEDWLLTGMLFREWGEEPGSYAYDASGLSAGDNYVVVLHGDAGTFTILPSGDFGGGFGGGVYDPIYPVHQIIQLNNGRKLDIILNTTTMLTINKQEYARMVFDTEDNKVRPFSPSFRITKNGEQVLLNLEAEPELGPNGGYVTDFDGNKEYRGRRLELGHGTLTRLRNNGITHISLALKDITVVLSLDDLINESVAAIGEENRFSLSRVKYLITITPKVEKNDLTEEETAALGGKLPISDMYRATVEIAVDGNSYDIAPLLKEMQVIIDLETTSRLIEEQMIAAELSKETTKGGTGVAGASDDLAVWDFTPYLEKMFTVMALTDDGYALEYPGRYIVPYMASEKLAPFSGIRRSDRYIIADANYSGIYFAFRLPDPVLPQEEAPQGE